MKLDKYKLITAGLVGITVCFGIMMVSAYADTPASSSSSANASVTVSNTINLTLTGGDLVIDNLTPGNASDSNIITATITSNSPYGYHLSATTGTSSGTTSLVNTADSNFSFTNLNANKATLNDFSDNTWGYSYSTDNGTSWISGDNGSAIAGYNGLLLDADDSGATGVKLLSSDSFATSGSVQFKIGARASSSQAAGTYTGTVNFYAVANRGPMTFDEAYADAGKEKLNGYYQMQDATPAICTAVAEGQVGQVIDTRDETVYHIGKLADGRCWLLDNLALDLASSTVLNGMNESNTHASNTTLNYLKGTTTRDPSTDPDGQYATAGVSNWTSSYSYSVPLVNLTDKDVVPTDATSTAGQYKVGGYYNYCAASAGSYCYGNGTSEGTSSGNAAEDICPKGWRMPAGNTTGEYQALYNNSSYNTYANYRSALHLPLSGIFYGGSANYQGSEGRWWSSTRYNSKFYGMYILITGASSDIYPAYNYSRYYGFSVRCLVDS